MTLSYVLLQNFKRNPLRSALTTLAFALPMAVFVAAISMLILLAKIGNEAQKELRVGVHHKTTIINLLPSGMRRKIEALDEGKGRLTAVCGMRWFGGRVPGEKMPISSLGADPDTFPLVYPETELSPDEIEAWKKDRQAAIVGAGIASQYRDRFPGWEKGGRITLKSSVPPYLELEFHIVKIVDAKTRAKDSFYLRRDYLAEALKSAGVDNYDDSNIYWVKCKSVAGLHELQREIDAAFSNTSDETRSEDENTLFAGFMQASGNIPAFMQAMAFVVVIIIALVAGNTQMMSLRERTRELAVLKAIGFPNGRILTLVLGESVGQALVGACVGIVPVVILLAAFPIDRLRIPGVSGLTVSPIAVAASATIAVLVGVIAGAWPAYQAVRMRTTDALRSVN